MTTDFIDIPSGSTVKEVFDKLIKVGRIKVKQEKNFSEIYIEVVEGAKGLVDFKELEDN